MTIREMVKAAADLEHLALQYLNDCVQNARTMGKRGHQYTKVTFTTDAMTPNDLMWLACDAPRPVERKPKFVGVILWIPMQDYERMSGEQAGGSAPATNAVATKTE